MPPSKNTYQQKINNEKTCQIARLKFSFQSFFLAKIVHTQVLGRIHLCSKNVNIWFKYLGMLRNIYVPEQGAHMFVPHQLLNTTYGPEVLLPCPQQFPHHPGSDDGCERGRELQLRGQHLHFLVFQAANQGCLKTSMSKKVGRSSMRALNV